MAVTLYFVAGEASGDTHGAALMRALREVQPDLVFRGRGGPHMSAIAGGSFKNWTDAAAIVGLWEVIKRYGFFRREFFAAIHDVTANRPDAIVLIDYPGFNLRLARALRKRFPRLKIIYYVSPQVWAWNRARIPRMARYLDLMLCIFPFEAPLYNESGLRTIFVGHPMMENLAERRVDLPRDQNLVGLFPGSRLREVRKILPVMIQAGREIALHRPLVRFQIAAASPKLAEEIGDLLSKSRMDVTTFGIITDASAETMQSVAVGIIASGTATLEAAYFRCPFVLVYKVSWLTYFAARLVVKIKHLGMPNVLAGKEIVREFIQAKARPGDIAAAVLNLMNDTAARSVMIGEFDAIIDKLGRSDASITASRAILQEIGAS